MRIALVDDDENFRSQTAQTLKLLLDERGMVADVSSFTSAEELLAASSGGSEKPETVFDLYLLDLILPKMDGMALARRIREKQPEAPIVFFTTSPEFALESYSVGAADYVVKPFERELFNRALDRAFRQLAEVRPADWVVRTSEGAVRLRLADVVFAEAAGHYQVVHFAGGGTQVLSLSLQGLWEKLAGDVRFVRVGRQCVVNLAYVVALGEGELKLADGQTRPVPRRQMAEVRAAFMRYFRV